MNLMRFNHQPTFSSLFENLERSQPHNFHNHNSTLPMVNVKNEDSQFIVELAAPGLDKSDFTIKLENNKLSVSTAQNDEKAEENVNYTLKEYSFNSFTRSFVLPKNIKHEAVNADYKNGILSISIPKKEAEAKLNRQIEIA